MAYALITTPENSWIILHSSYDTDVSEFMREDFLVSTISSSRTIGYDSYLE